MLIAGLLTFAVLQTIASNYFSGGFMVSFPKFFDSVLAAALGFASGYVICCTLILILGLLPVTSYHVVDDILGPSNQPPVMRKTVTASCNLVGTASLQMYPAVTDDIITDFLDLRSQRLEDTRRNRQPTDTRRQELPTAL